MSHLNDNKSDGIKMNAPRDPASGGAEEIEELNKMAPSKDELKQELEQKNKQIGELSRRIDELTAFLYNLLEQYQNDFLQDSSAFMSRATVSQQIRAKLKMTPQMFEIISKSREQAEQNGQ